MTLEKGFDYIIVGSGPGGASIAKELSNLTPHARVLIVEYGPRLLKTGIRNIASSSILYDNDKQPIRSDGGVWIGRARVLGGSSYVGMGNAVTPPKSILHEWGMDLSTELDSAKMDMHVSLMPRNLIGKGTAKITDGAQSLGLDMKPTPKCIDFSKCMGCGQCMWGCPTQAKWTSRDFIDDAVNNGAKLLLNTKVTRVMHKNGNVVGINAIHDGKELNIKGLKVILSAGALGTPMILQQTGLSDAGKGIALDVFQTTYGYTKDVGMQNEHIMAVYVDQFIEEKELFSAPYMYHPYFLVRDIKGYTPSRIGITEQLKMFYKSRGIDAKRLIGMMTKIRDEITGEVRPDGTIKKTLTDKDHAKLDEAHEINKEILIAAGANPRTILRGVYEAGHPCCTAPIGKIVNANQETQIKGLFISDASIFPSPLGMPPTLTIVALSKKLAQFITE